jgi:predicted DNA-binding transcriptional regulator YafY
MRHEKAQSLLHLARVLAGSAEGLTLDEMAEVAGTGRRTVERMRDALEQLFPQMEVIEEPPSKRYRMTSGLDGLFQAPTAEELVALGTTAEAMRAGGNHDRAAALASIEIKVRASMRSSALRKLVPDMEALLHAETVAVQAGPRPFEDETVLATVRHAVKAMCGLKFAYDGGSTPGRLREVAPYGLMFGRTNYLVAAELGSEEPKSWRLDRIRDLTLMDCPAPAPDDFSLSAFAADPSASSTAMQSMWFCGSSRTGRPMRWAGASIPTKKSPNSRTDLCWSAFGPAGCWSWRGTCSPGPTRLRSWRRRGFRP